MNFAHFGDLYKIPSSNGLSRPSAERGVGYKMIGMGELFANNIINDIDMERVLMNEKEKSKFLVQKGDLLFARQSLVAEGAGKCSIVNALTEETTFESHLIRVRLEQSKCNPFFFYYLFCLKSSPVKSIINQCAQAGIRGNELAKIKVPVIDLEHQNKIASILSAYDNLIENNNKRIKILEQMAENLYKEWFVRFRFPGYETAEFENGLPKGWTIKRLFEFGKIITGKTPSMEHAEYYGGNILFVKTPDMHEKIFVFKTEETLTSTGSKVQKSTLLPENSIMVSCIGTAGIVGINTEPAHTNQQINSIILNDTNYLEWMYYTCSFLKNTIEAYGATGATMTNLSKGKFEKLKVIEPSLDLIYMFHKKVCLVFEEIKKLSKQNSNLIKQRDLLLPRLMSGKLVV